MLTALQASRTILTRLSMVSAGPPQPHLLANRLTDTVTLGRTMRKILSSILLLGVATQAVAQTAAVTAADYDRARGLAAKYRPLVIDAIESPTWSGNSRLLYRKIGGRWEHVHARRRHQSRRAGETRRLRS